MQSLEPRSQARNEGCPRAMGRARRRPGDRIAPSLSRACLRLLRWLAAPVALRQRQDRRARAHRRCHPVSSSAARPRGAPSRATRALRAAAPDGQGQGRAGHSILEGALSSPPARSTPSRTATPSSPTSSPPSRTSGLTRAGPSAGSSTSSKRSGPASSRCPSRSPRPTSSPRRRSTRRRSCGSTPTATPSPRRMHDEP